MTSPDQSTGPQVRVYVAAGGNEFMADIGGWLVEAAKLCGRDAALCDDGSLPTADGAVNLVVAPHEFYELSDSSDAERHRAAQCSIPVCTEQPGTKWFDMTVLLVEASPLALDINEHGVAALQERGIPAQHLRLGAVPSMNRTARADVQGDVERDIDVLFMGGLTDHRATALAQLGPHLWHRRADLRLFDFGRPVQGDVAGLVFGDDKYDLLARANILVNVHRDHSSAGYFEWARMVEAMANGCTVVTEPSTGFSPLVAGEHFIETDDLAATVAALLDDPLRCRQIGALAAAAVLDEFPLAATLGPVLDSIPPVATGLVGSGGRTSRTPKYRARLQRAQQMPLLPAFQPDRALRRQVGEALHAEVEIRRDLDALACQVLHGDPQHIERITTPAYDDAHPEVTVIVTLFNYETVVLETLDSIVASTDVDYEVVVVDDHSTDGGRAAVADFMNRHPDVPMLLLGCDSNRGLPVARNLAFGQARSDKVMVMDADNHVYPTCLRKLADALDADPEASFAWAILEEFGIEAGLRSAVGWHVPWLCAANNIDAQAMIRTSVWQSLGGYRTDDALVFGWEDWELWLRIAASGGHGVHVRQILGRYRRQENSMLATSNLFSDIMADHLRTLHPSLPWPS